MEKAKKQPTNQTNQQCNTIFQREKAVLQENHLKMGCHCMSLCEMLYGKLEQESLTLGQSLECCQKKNNFVSDLSLFQCYLLVIHQMCLNIITYLISKRGSADVRSQAGTKCLLMLNCSGGCMNCVMIQTISQFCLNSSAVYQR